jgi:hypothetical protein
MRTGTFIHRSTVQKSTYRRLYLYIRIHTHLFKNEHHTFKISFKNRNFTIENVAEVSLGARWVYRHMYSTPYSLIVSLIWWLAGFITLELKQYSHMLNTYVCSCIYVAAWKWVRLRVLCGPRFTITLSAQRTLWPKDVQLYSRLYVLSEPSLYSCTVGVLEFKAADGDRVARWPWRRPFSKNVAVENFFWPWQIGGCEWLWSGRKGFKKAQMWP